jgi:hypothetical protein
VMRAFLLIIALAAAPGCSLFSQAPYAGRACREDSECFQAQGESCHRELKVCCVDCLPDAAPPDAEIFDGGPDGDLVDAGVVDAAPVDGAIDAS